MLGLLVPSVANPFHGALARHVEEAALERGFQVVFGSSLRDPAREVRYAEDFWNFGIQGRDYRLVPSRPRPSGRSCQRRGLRIVVFDRNISAAESMPPVDSVSMDNCAAGYLATRHLIELGHTRVGYISGVRRRPPRAAIGSRLSQGLTEVGIPVDAALIPNMPVAVGYDDTHGAEVGRSIAFALLQAKPHLTGLVALNDMYAIGACAAVRELGMTVPEDISVTSIDDIMLAGYRRSAPHHRPSPHRGAERRCRRAANLAPPRKG